VPQDNDQSKPGTFHYEAGIPVLNRINEIETQRAAERKAEAEYKERQLAISRGMLIANFIIACAAIIGGAVTSYQAHVAKISADAAGDNAAAAKVMAEEMKKSGADTHDLALAAKDQATAALRQVASLDAEVRESHALVENSRENLNTLRSNFIKDQRPYMAAKPDDPKIEEGKRLLWNVHFVNYGRSPAVDVATCVALLIGEDVRPLLTEEAIRQRCNHPQSLEITSLGIAPPGDNLFTTGYSQENLTADQVRIIKEGNFKIALTGVITYKDMAGTKYTYIYCNVRLSGGGLADCAQSGYMQ